MAKTRGGREQVPVNLPPDVFDAWERARKGCGNTTFGIAALAAFLTLPRDQQEQLSTLARHVHEKGGGSWLEMQKGIARIRADLKPAAGSTKKKPARKAKRKPR